MARGWESKAVENQQQEALAKPAPSAGPAVDPALETERASLGLARARALADLQVACAPAHRAMLEHAIRDLDARLSALG
jgi:hypothetical protein